ncbi:hypothetical protein [Nocardia sp. NPDC127526]|uniref:hypothetical protein n=1 Tax=Nocardia sp. NPDC127526 TaxID=3345393 RepID=UPI00364054AE
MSPSGPSVIRYLLHDALVLLGADAAVQAAWLDKHSVSADEIALVFDDAFRLVQDRDIDKGITTTLREIDTLLGEMSGQEHAERWTRAGLAVDEGWSRARQLAREALVELTGSWDDPPAEHPADSPR